MFKEGVEVVRLTGYHEKEEYTKNLDMILETDASVMMEFEWK